MVQLTQTEKDNLILLYKEDFANFFNIGFDGERYLFSINKNMYFKNIENMAPSFYFNYEIQERDTWTLISYKNYETIELWWLICRVNQIYNPTISPVPGEVVKLLQKEVVDDILSTMI